MDLGDLLNARRPVEVSWMGESMQLAYDPCGWDERLHLAFQRAMTLGDDDPEKTRINDTILVSMLREWDITQGGVVLPVSEDVLKQLPILLRLKMARAVAGDVMADAGPKESSSARRTTNGSLVMAAEAIARSTPTSFEPVEGWGTDNPG